MCPTTGSGHEANRSSIFFLWLVGSTDSETILYAYGKKNTTTTKEFLSRWPLTRKTGNFFSICVDGSMYRMR